MRLGGKPRDEVLELMNQQSQSTMPSQQRDHATVTRQTADGVSVKISQSFPLLSNFRTMVDTAVLLRILSELAARAFAVSKWRELSDSVLLNYDIWPSQDSDS